MNVGAGTQRPAPFPVFTHFGTPMTGMHSPGVTGPAFLGAGAQSAGPAPIMGMGSLQQPPFLLAQHQAQQQQMMVNQMNQMHHAMLEQQKLLQGLHVQAQDRYQRQLDEAQARITNLETSYVSPSRSVPGVSFADSRPATSGRHSIYMGRTKKEFDASAIEKALYHFRFEQKFSGGRSEDIDTFLRAFERAVRSKERPLWVLFLDRQLSGQAAIAFQSAFPDIHDAEYSEAVEFLQQKYRQLRHLYNTNQSLSRLRQTGSVTTFFNTYDTLQYRIADVPVEERLESVFVAMMASALKPPILKRLLEDSGKLGAGYTIEQLKKDATSIEAAVRDTEYAAPGRPRYKSARVATADSQSTEKSDDSKKAESPEYAAYVAELRKSGRLDGEVGPRPAYEHPEWYRRDGHSCRFCKSLKHNTALCPKLYERVNPGKTMPKSLVEANKAILQLD